jgi:hypothetical protein
MPSSIMPSLGLFVVKLLLYFGVVAAGSFRWGATLERKQLRIFLGGLARFALGGVVGIPAGFILRGVFGSDGSFGFYALYFTLRFLLWLVVLRIAFLKAPIGEVAGLALAGAALNAGLDLALPDSLQQMFSFNIC